MTGPQSRVTWRGDLAGEYDWEMDVNPYDSPRETVSNSEAVRNAPVRRTWLYWIFDTLALLAAAVGGLPILFVLIVVAMRAIRFYFKWLAA
jgi:hypothetical protein